MNITQGNLLPEIQAPVKNADGTPINVTGSTIKFSMVNCETDAVKINGVAAAIVDGPTGLIKYTWTGTDTDTPGKFRGEFEITIGGKKLTAPNDSYIPIDIKAKLT